MLANTQGTIYYTVDGSKPDESGLVYSSPVFLESGQYDIRAVFINSYGVESDETQEHYFVDVTVGIFTPHHHFGRGARGLYGILYH